MFDMTALQRIKFLISGVGVLMVTMEIHSRLDNRVLLVNAMAM